jgi:hypothetical protein
LDLNAARGCIDLESRAGVILGGAFAPAEGNRCRSGRMRLSIEQIDGFPGQQSACWLAGRPYTSREISVKWHFIFLS